MDKVRAIAKVIWEQRFWVLSVLGLIVAVVCWNMASGALDAQFGTRKSAIDKQFSDMQGLLGKQVHPNQVVNDENQKQVDQQSEIVNAVWETLYERQKESVLKWPKELGEEFVAYIEKLKFRDPISNDMRSEYQNYIGKRFDGLLEIADALKLAEGSTMGGYGGGRGGEYGGGGRSYGGPAETGTPGMDQDYLVEWLDQDKLRAKLAFATNKPTALQIWVTQEDLWVYETLLKVIARTNKARGSTRPDNAAIRTIVSLEVGSGAAQTSYSAGHVFMPSAPGGDVALGTGGEMMDGGGRGGEYGASPEMMDGGGRGGEYGGFGAEAADPAALDAAILTNRYLGDDGKPLAGEGDLGKEFRQLPVRMELVMDQRWIPRLLIECANSPLPIEVKQLRINPDKSLAGFEGVGGMSSSMGSGTSVAINDPAFALVELKGVVFIYNEPGAEPGAEPAAADGQVAAQ